MLLFQIRFPTVGGKANENLRMCPYFDRCAKHGESPLHYKWGKIVIMISKWVCDRWRYNAPIQGCTIDGVK
jgi:hypothetical protein